MEIAIEPFVGPFNLLTFGPLLLEEAKEAPTHAPRRCAARQARSKKPAYFMQFDLEDLFAYQEMGIDYIVVFSFANNAKEHDEFPPK